MHTCNILYINIIHVYTIYINNEKSNNKNYSNCQGDVGCPGESQRYKTPPSGSCLEPKGCSVMH